MSSYFFCFSFWGLLKGVRHLNLHPLVHTFVTQSSCWWKAPAFQHLVTCQGMCWGFMHLALESIQNLYLWYYRCAWGYENVKGYCAVISEFVVGWMPDWGGRGVDGPAMLGTSLVPRWGRFWRKVNSPSNQGSNLQFGFSSNSFAILL